METWSEQGCRILRCRTAEEARLQPREELEAAVDSICKHVKDLVRCTWQDRMSGRFSC